MTWDGDISRIGKLAERVKDLASVPQHAALTVAKSIEELIKEEFSSGTDPYGSAWAPLSPVTEARGRHAPPLTDTGAMRDSVNVYATGNGIAITVAHPAAPHQTGWSGPRGSGPARPILPARDRLPATWREAIYSAIDEDIRKVAG